jgi:tRNA threonylcarbamoyladenosine biosynthesis protein TsaE
VASLVVRAETAEAMQALGERLGRALRAGDVLALVGPLGAGKTTFVQGLARGAGVPPDRHVASPTFALVNEHPGRVALVHADLYRIANERELFELGLDDAFDRAAVAIEWLDRFPEAAPADRLEIAIAFEPDGARQITATGRGPRGDALVRALGPSPNPLPRTGEG